MSGIVSKSNIVKIYFSPLGTEEIRTQACAEVISPDNFSTSIPEDGGVSDAHMGTISYDYKCLTCKNSKKLCLGHPGKIECNYPVYNEILFNDMKKWLKVICFKCGNSIINLKNVMNIPKGKRLLEAAKIATQAAGKACGTCGEIKPMIKKNPKQPLILFTSSKEEGAAAMPTIDNKLWPHLIFQYLNRVTNDLVITLGRSPEAHPRKCILFAIIVPSNNIRPDVRNTGGGRGSNDDLTVMLQALSKENNRLPVVNPGTNVIIDAELEEKINTFISLHYAFVKGQVGTKKILNGSIAGMVSLSARIKSKYGRIRRNLMGKRVRICARSIISGDPVLKPWEFGIPLYVAKTLYVVETVQEWNREKLSSYFLNGKKKYPGSIRVVKADGREMSVERCQLEIGDKLYRNLITGDVGCFNRQPSLLPSTISAHRIVVCEDPDILTFRMNPISLVLYHGDFDGDEMNLYINTSAATRNETEILSSVPNWLITINKASLQLGQVDDSVIGSFELTRNGVSMSKYNAMQMFANSTFMPAFGTKTKKATYTGAEIYSLVLQETPFNYSKAPQYFDQKYAGAIQYDPYETMTKIENGRLIQGVIDKAAIGKEKEGSIYHIVANDYGNERALEMIYNTQQIALNYILLCGFSVGIKDIITPQETLDKIHLLEESILKRAEVIINRLREGSIIPPLNKTVKEFFEELQINELRIMDDFLPLILESVDQYSNNLFKLIMSGSKGSPNNMLQMKSAGGQIITDGKRPALNFGYERPYPYAERFTKDPKHLGFVLDCFFVGLSVNAFIFNSMNARRDFIGKALSTATTGEQNRKSIKSLESIITDNFRRSCKSNGAIVQYLYGDDGFDVRKVIRVKFSAIMYDNAKFEKEFHFKSDGKNQSIFDEEFAVLKMYRDKYRDLFIKYEGSSVKDMMSDSKMVAADPSRILNDLLSKYKIATSAQKNIADEVAAMTTDLNRFIDGLKYVYLNENCEAAGITVPETMANGLWLQIFAIRLHLSSTILAKNNVSRWIFAETLKMIKYKISMALIDYGAAVGITAAMAFSAPLTQYMLDSTRGHVGGTSKSSMEHAKEVLAARPTANMVAPQMLLVIKDDIISGTKSKEEIAKELATKIETLRLITFVASWQLFYEQFAAPAHPSYVAEAADIEKFKKLNPLLVPPSNLLKWCIRIVLDKTTLILKKVTVETIVRRIREIYEGNVYITYTGINDNTTYLRIYLVNSYFKNHVEEDAILGEKDRILNIILRGMEGVISAAPQKLMRSKVDPATGAIVRDDNAWGVLTVGTNLNAALILPEVDPYKSHSDSVEETSKVFGLEAAFVRLTSEIQALGEGGLNPHHAYMYGAEMTYGGTVTSVERGGATKRDANNILLRLGFSSPVQAIEEAVSTGVENEVTGLTGKLMVGSTPISGTNYNTFVVNIDFVKNNTKSTSAYIEEL